MTSRRAVLTGMIAVAAAPAAAVAQPSQLDRLLAAHQAALAEYDAATEALELLAPLAENPPAAYVGNCLNLQDGERRPILAYTPDEIRRHYDAYRSEAASPLTSPLTLRRDAKVAEFEPLYRAHQERLAAAGYFAADERLTAAGKALVVAEDAIIDHRPATMAEVTAKARFLLDTPAFEDEVFARQFARSLVGEEAI